MAMQRSASRLLFAAALLLPGVVTTTLAADVLDQAQSATVIGPSNPLLAEGTDALEAGRFEEGVRLTLAGLEQPTNDRDKAAGHSNVCAGYAALKRWEEALDHCNQALELDRGNWRTFNNRAAVFVGLRKFDLAMADVNAGLELAPDSPTLHKSREVVLEHHAADRRARWRRPNKA